MPDAWRAAYRLGLFPEITRKATSACAEAIRLIACLQLAADGQVI